MARKLSGDRILFIVTVSLVVFGLLMVFSSSVMLATANYGSPRAFFWRQLAWAAMGMVALWFLMHMDYRILRHPAIVFPGICVALAMLGLALVADPHQATHRWLRWGMFSFQPSEFAKLMLVVFLAYFLEKRVGKINDLAGTIAPSLVIIVLMLGLIAKEPDLGTPVAMLATTATIFYIAGLRLRYFLYALAGCLPLLYFAIAGVGYRHRRILAFLNPYADPLGTGFQIIQSLIAVGTGGLTGLGLMNGKQKLFFLPAPHTDYIFAVTAEETGLLGALILIALFGVYFWRGWRAALYAPDDFGRYLAAGLTITVACQALINMSVVLAMVPPKGIPLPFLSYGGSSLFFSLVSTGILLNISQRADCGVKMRSLQVTV
ncbi:MAG: putative lipid II flippase FtsW [Acidobacteria bacterium]|nr:putative lipid II flippase FtsW [Acidobacteriota bacterium]